MKRNLFELTLLMKLFTFPFNVINFVFLFYNDIIIYWDISVVPP